MKKKVLLLIGLLWLTCGCTAYYDVNMAGEGILETVHVNASNEEDKAILKGYSFYTPAFYDEVGASEENIKIDGVEYYTITHQNDIDFTYHFSSSNYSRSAMVKGCYGNFEATKSSENILVSTSKEFSCFAMYPNLTSVEVQLHVPNDYELVSTNSKNINGTTYRWTLEKGKQDNSIFLSMKKKQNAVSSQTDVSSTDVKEDDPDKTVFLVLGMILAFLIVLAILIRFSGKK